LQLPGQPIDYVLRPRLGLVTHDMPPQPVAPPARRRLMSVGPTAQAVGRAPVSRLSVLTL
jgi:hypothetical protein